MIVQEFAQRELIRLSTAPGSAPYSNAAVFGDLVWTSGALPTNSAGEVPDSFPEQVRAALANLQSFLTAAGADWSTVLKVNGYVADITQLPVLNEIYTEVVCQDGKPARTTVEVSRFRGKTQVEFDAVAYRRRPNQER